MPASAAPRDEGAAVPDALAPPRGHPHYALADGARGMAALSVVVFHAWLRSGAGGRETWAKAASNVIFGPEVFFILSAFLLYRPFVASRVYGLPRHSFGGFGRNRALRIFPAYWFFLTAYALVIGLPGDVFGHWWAYYTQTHIYFASTAAGGLGVSWTLCVELSFYLALPLAVLATDRLVRSRGEASARNVELFALALCIPISWLYVDAIRGTGSPTASEYGWSLALPGDVAYFAMGMALARLTVPLPGEPTLRERVKLPWPLFSGGCWAIAFLIFLWKIDHVSAPASRFLLNGFIGLFLMIPVFLATERDRGVESWLAWRPFRWLGLVSYGIYLAHPPLLHELARHGVGDASFGGFITLLLVGGSSAVVLGALSYYLVERPFLRLKTGHGGGARDRPSPAEPQGTLTAS
jgi:peptidoglycan/LPS O-acetylase OafA/YrhL